MTTSQEHLCNIPVSLEVEISFEQDQIRCLKADLEILEKRLHTLKLIKSLQQAKPGCISFAKINPSKIAKINDQNWMEARLIDIVGKTEEKKHASYYQCPNCNKRNPLIRYSYGAYCGNSEYEDAVKIYMICTSSKCRLAIYSMDSSIDLSSKKWFDHKSGGWIRSAKQKPR